MSEDHEEKKEGTFEFYAAGKGGEAFEDGENAGGDMYGNHTFIYCIVAREVPI